MPGFFDVLIRLVESYPLFGATIALGALLYLGLMMSGPRAH